MNKDNIVLTGGDGLTGQTGQEVLDNVKLGLNAALGEREYIPSDFVWSTANLAGFTGKTLVIQHTFTATANFALPDLAILEFDGGKLIITGTITGSKTRVINHSNLQIFSTLTTFAGTWLEVVATPQWFGGYPSINNTITEAQGAIDVKPIIDKILASPFGIKFPVGCYYRKGEANAITKPIPFIFEGDNLEQSFLYSLAYEPNHVRFYSDDNNPFFEIRSTGVVMKGFTCDVQLCANYNNPVLFEHADYKVNGCRIDVTIVDTLAHCRAADPATNTGVKGFEFIVAGSSVDYGSLCNLHLNINTRYVAYPVIFNEVSGSGRTGTWITTNFVSGTWVGYKKFYLCGMSGSQHKIVTQTAYTLTGAEVNTLYSGYVGACELDILPWDLTGSQYNSEDWYYNKLGIVIGEGVTPVGNSLIGLNYSWFTGARFNSVKLIDNKSDIVLLRDRWSNNSFISQLDNTLIGFVEYGGSVSVAAYNGSLIDFDTNLTEGTEATTANITISGAANLMTYSRLVITENNPTRWQFGAGADLNKDFVEIVLDGTNNNIISNMFFLHLLYENTKCKRIQIIGTNTSDVKTVYEGTIPNVNTKSIMSFLTDKTFKKIVIRFIGSTNTTGTIYLLDIANKNNHRNNVVYRHELALEFEAFLTQSETSAPTATIVTNTLNPELQYSSVGTYFIYLFNQFPAEKTMPHLLKYVDPDTGIKVVLTRVNNNYYSIQTYNSSGVLANGILNDFFVSIKRKI